MQKHSWIKIAVAACVAIVLSGCERGAKDENAQHYQTRGLARGFSPDRSTIEIEHENIPGFMPSMTMPFVARNQKEVADLKTGDAISFRMNVTKKDFWIDQVKKVQRDEVHVAEPHPKSTVSPTNSARLREGDPMPALSLTDQDGKQISLKTLRGQRFVLTFVFTRCPVPTFCPRMSNNFSELQTAIKSDKGGLANTHLLSITLDPSFDTPDILKQYSDSHAADAKIWSFATGDPKEIDALTRAFSVYVQTEGGTISHGLATALVNANGKIEKIWRGNAWMPAEVLEAIRAESK
jgi:protein SCO1/2